jgi:hypothetical protein
MSRKKQFDYTRTLLEKQKGNWNDMTLLERRASTPYSVRKVSQQADAA